VSVDDRRGNAMKAAPRNPLGFHERHFSTLLTKRELRVAIRADRVHVCRLVVVEVDDDPVSPYEK